MRRIITAYFVPDRVLASFVLSLAEAIGFAVYFKADLIDPEIASIEPLYTRVQDAHVLHARRECDSRSLSAGMQHEHCPQYP